MSFDAISLIRQFITPDVIAKIAAALGLDRGQTQSAAGALIPAILAGLLGAGQRPGGARTLGEAINTQDQGILGNLGSLIGGSGQASLIESGSKVLGGLLGGSASSALATAAGRFSGIGDSGAKGLLGILGPVVLGALGQQQRSSGLDASGLVNLLATQKDKIASALPAGFAKEIQGTGLLDSVASHLPRAAAAPSGRSSPSTSSGLPSFLPWLAGLAALALLLWLFTGRSHDPGYSSLPQADVSTVAGASQQVTALGDRLRMILGSVNDETSAKAAVPRLTEINTELDRIKSAAANFPAAERSTLSSAIATLVAALAPKVEEVLKIPGVGAILKPVLDTALARLAEIGKK